MVELKKERIEEILHEETVKTEDQKTILRAIYNRYMHLYEEYLSDIDKLNDKKIAELKKYHEETESFMKYYYIDIPYDVCAKLKEFDLQYTDKLLGTKWQEYVSDELKQFATKNKNKSEEELKVKFTKEKLEAFYGVIDSVFRESFDTGSKTVERTTKWFVGLFSGSDNGKK